MNKDYIKVEDLKHNYIYRIRARNGIAGVWNENTGEFILYRVKFHDHYTFGEIHYDLSDHFGTARPYEELEECPYDIEDYDEKAMLTYLKEWETKLNDPHPRERL